MVSEEIDVLKLYAGLIPGFEDHTKWNAWLAKCYQYDRVNELAKVMRGIQMGMATAEKKKLANQEVVDTYCRWIGSIDKTLRRIMKKNRKFAVDRDSKKQMDNDLEEWIRKQMF